MTSIVPADKTARDDLAAKIIADRGLIDAPSDVKRLSAQTIAELMGNVTEEEAK